jgi:hypothetical protein
VSQTRCRTSNGTRRMHENAVELTGIDFPRFLTRENRFDAAWKLICQSSLLSVNSAFNTLRLLIPTEPKNRKLSKIETLRLAKSYISHLSATLVIGEWRRRRTFSFMKMIYRPQEVPRVDSLALKSPTKARSTLESTTDPTSAHSASLQSFIKDGLIRLKWF